jgi:beta-lactamase class A
LPAAAKNWYGKRGDVAVLRDRDDLSAVMAAVVAGEPGTYSAAVIDLATGRRWLLNPQRMRSASLIKLFILAEAFRRAGRGELALEEAVAVPEEPRWAAPGRWRCRRRDGANVAATARSDDRGER